jgi:2-keto-4-pentenoate hydratase
MAATKLSDIEIEQAVAGLDRAREACAAAAPFELESLADGYRIQRAWTAARVDGGARRAGWKIGATNAQSQAALGATEPMFGALLSDDELASGASCPRASLIRPLCEAELAFRLGSALGGEDPSVDDVLAATDGLAGAIEVVDSRLAPELSGPQYAVADAARAARYVLGDWVDPARVSATAAVSVTVHDRGTLLAHGDGSRVLGDPARAVGWLARALAHQGLALEPGDVVLAGTLIAPLPISGGEHIRVEFSEPLATLTLHFT